MTQLRRLENMRRDFAASVSHEIKTPLTAIKGFVETLCAGEGVDVKLACEAGLGGRFDATLLEQAAVNLLDNAIKYSPAKSAIQIEALTVDDEIQIRFTDQGMGIAQKHLPRLFERFYRVDKAHSRKLGGTGLGLAIVKHIAQAHGGNVTVESDLGKGSTFTLRLPVKQQA